MMGVHSKADRAAAKPRLRAWVRSAARGLVGLDRGRGFLVLRRMSPLGRLAFVGGYVPIFGALCLIFALFGEFAGWAFEFAVVLTAYVYVMLTTAWLDVRHPSP